MWQHDDELVRQSRVLANLGGLYSIPQRLAMAGPGRRTGRQDDFRVTDPALARVVMYYACAVVRDDAATAVGSSGCGRKAVALFGGIPLFALIAAVAGYVVVPEKPP